MDERERFGQYLARLRRAAGMSQRELADVLCQLSGTQSVTRSEVSRYERGTRLPEIWLPFIAEALHTPLPGLQRAAATARWPEPQPEPAPGIADFLPDDGALTAPAAGGRRLGATTVREVMHRVHALRLADDVMYGRDLLAPATRELKRVMQLYRDSSVTDEIGRNLLTAIGELAQIAGWIASDAGQTRQAEQIYRVGMSAAHSAGDATLAGNILGSLAYQVANVGDPAEAVTMAQAALDDAGEQAPPRARALYFDRLAWAHAQAGQAQPAMRALGEAGQSLAHNANEEDPAYLYWVNADELRIMEARVFTELHRPLRAVPLLTDVLGQYAATHTRELALYRSWLAVALADANEPEESAAEAERVISLSADTASDRTAERTRVILRRLQEFADVPEVRTLLAEHDHLLTA